MRNRKKIFTTDKVKDYRTQNLQMASKYIKNSQSH